MTRTNPRAVPPLPFTLVVKRLRGGFERHDFDATSVAAAKRKAWALVKADPSWKRATLRCRGEVVATIDCVSLRWSEVRA